MCVEEKLKAKALANVYGSRNVYTTLNSKMTSPTYYSNYVLTEGYRLILTKYRTGSHYLIIKTGSYHRKLPQERLCSCKKIQSLQHVIFECELTAAIRHRNFPCSLEEFFEKAEDAAIVLRKIEKLLKLR